MAERGKSSRKITKGKSKANGKGKPAKVKAAKHGKRGHNGGPPLTNGDVPDEIRRRHRGLIDAARVRMKKAEEPFKQAKGEYRAAIKLARDEGCNTDAMLLAYNLDQQDPLTVAQLYRDTGIELAKTKNSSLGQLNLFGAIDLPPLENPTLAGESAGRKGDPREDNPHTPGSEAYVDYDNAWQKGQAALAEGLGRG